MDNPTASIGLGASAPSRHDFHGGSSDQREVDRTITYIVFLILVTTALAQSAVAIVLSALACKATCCQASKVGAVYYNNSAYRGGAQYLPQTAHVAMPTPLSINPSVAAGGTLPRAVALHIPPNAMNLTDGTAYPMSGCNSEKRRDRNDSDYTRFY